MARVNEEDEEKKEEEGGRLKGDNQLIKRINIVFSEKHHSEFFVFKAAYNSRYHFTQRHEGYQLQVKLFLKS